MQAVVHLMQALHHKDHASLDPACPLSLHHAVVKVAIPCLQNSTALVTGTLGLSFSKTAAAMRKAVSVARSGPCAVLVDINWRPVFWESLTPQAVQIVSEYAGGADILKLSEEEAEWLYGVHSDQAMKQPDLVGLTPSTTVSHSMHATSWCHQHLESFLLVANFTTVSMQPFIAVVPLTAAFANTHVLQQTQR